MYHSGRVYKNENLVGKKRRVKIRIELVSTGPRVLKNPFFLNLFNSVQWMKEVNMWTDGREDELVGLSISLTLKQCRQRCL